MRNSRGLGLMVASALAWGAWWPLTSSSLPDSVVSSATGVLPRARASHPSPALNSPSRFPGWFEANEGRFGEEIDFVARRGNSAIYLSDGDAVVTVAPIVRADTDRQSIRADRRRSEARRPAAVLMTLAGRDQRARGVGLDPLHARVNYFRGNDRRKWRSNLQTYSRVKYSDVYPGIDLVYYFDAAGQLEYDLIVAPGADPNVVRLRFAGVRNRRIDRAGNLILDIGDSTVRMRKPVIYQLAGEVKREVTGRYAMHRNRDLGFEIGDYDRSRPLWIDPAFDYSTFLGGAGTDEGAAIALDADGNAYVTGWTRSIDFPSAFPWQPDFRGFQDAFVAKFDPAGALVYCTYLGGLSRDEGRGIAVDAGGNAYVTGTTLAQSLFDSGFPTTTGAFQTTGVLDDAFIAKFDSSGVLMASTLLGGSASDSGLAIAADAAGNAYVTGSTTSPDFPTAAALQPAYGGATDAFVTKLNPVLTAVVYSTFLGGAHTDSGRGVAVDATGQASVAGSTSSTDFPTANAFQPTYAGATDAFVAKLNAAGSAFVFSTYFGGGLPGLGGSDEAAAVAVDAAGSTVVAGLTNSTDLPIVRAFQSQIAGPPSPVNGSFEDDGFVARVDPSGVLLQSTYLGGNGLDWIRGVDLDQSGAIFVTGLTRSTNFPITGDQASAMADIGAYKSTDGGATWMAAHDGLESPSLTALAIDPAAPSTLYAGTEKSGVFKSTDAGASWHSSNSGLTFPFIAALAIDPIVTSTLYAATAGGGVYKSTDGGSSWSRRNSGFLILNMISLAIDPRNPSTLYAGTLARGFGPLYKSSDGGDTWVAKPGFGITAIAVDPYTPATVYAASSVNLNRSLDGGSTWAVLFTEPSHLAPLTTVVVDPIQSSTLYVGTEGKGVFKTTDGGVTWQTVNAGLSTLVVTSLALAPTQPSTIYAGTTNGVFKSDNGGAAWSAARTGIADMVINQVAIDPRAATDVFVAAAGLFGDAFAAALDYEGNLLYSSYVGGGRFDSAAATAVEPWGAVHITGATRSLDWPLSAAPAQTMFGRGFSDGFVSRIACFMPLTLSTTAADPTLLWPPNHQMVRVVVDYTVTGCGVACSVGVSSNEPMNGPDDGDTAPDWEILDTRSVLLRAERAGTGNGRAYTVTTSCSDTTGHQTSKSREVLVPISPK